MSRRVEQLNYLAIGLLEKLGNIEPAELQIEIMEFILSQAIPRWEMFNKAFTLVEIIPILIRQKKY